MHEKKLKHCGNAPLLVALLFPKREGEVGCEELSSSQHEQGQCTNSRADDAETPSARHAETASDKQSTAAKIFHIAAPACNIRAGCCAHCNTSSGINQSLCKMHQQPATQQVKEKRVARAHAHEATRNFFQICENSLSKYKFSLKRA